MVVKPLVYALVSPSTHRGKKYMVSLRLLDGPMGAVNGGIYKRNELATIHFGAAGYEDYLMHGDDSRKRMYLMRHLPRENWNNPMTSGFWSRWLLWNRDTLAESARDVEQRFGFPVVLSHQIV